MIHKVGNQAVHSDIKLRQIDGVQLALLEHSPFLERYQDQVRELAAGLEEKRAIPLVNAHMPLILELQSDEYWQDISLPMLEEVRGNLRDLIKFIDKQGPRARIYPDFTDVHFERLDGVLPDQVNKVISIIRSVHDHARAAA